MVRYEQGQKYEAHHDFFDVCDLEDKTASGRRTVRVYTGLEYTIPYLYLPILEDKTASGRRTVQSVSQSVSTNPYHGA